MQITGLRLGFNGVYKLGCWTQAEVKLQGGDERITGAVEITVQDPEGVPATVVTPPSRAVGVMPGEATSARLFIRPGQDGADIHVRFLDEEGRERASRTFYPSPAPGDDYVPYGRPAANRIVASFGSPRGMADLTRGESTDDELTATHVIRIKDAADLPLEWYGYEAIHTMVLGGAQPRLYRPLAAAPQRIDALRRWVELGGRLVIFCGANAPELIGPNGPLASLVPGAFETVNPLREPQRLEAFSDSIATLARSGQAQIHVAKLIDVRGEILAFGGQNQVDLPLVVRARHGLGEVTFVAVDPDAPPLADWPGRINLLRNVLEWPTELGVGEAAVAAGIQRQDLIDHLRRKLDESFAGVQTASFGLVALLVVLYILVIGPGDYFLVRRLKRMELTWLTFPLAVFAVSAAAYWGAHEMKGNQLRVNQVEIVDVDLATNEARGTVWTHFFSPQVERYDLTLAPRFGDKPVSKLPARPRRAGELGEPAISAAPDRLVGWLGSSGYGLDGMEGRRGQTGLFHRGYRFSPQLEALVGLPVQEWSTRTLAGRWSATIEPPIEARLESLSDELLAGHLTNRTGLELEDCLLMHGNWAYKLPRLADGAVATIDDSLQPTTVKTALTGAARLSSPQAAGRDAAPRLDPLEATVDELAAAMMFHEAIGGEAYAQATNRYQQFVDLSHLLDGDQAILVARANKAAGSQWTGDDRTLSSAQDRRWVYYRFVIPLKPKPRILP